VSAGLKLRYRSGLPNYIANGQNKVFNSVHHAGLKYILQELEIEIGSACLYLNYNFPIGAQGVCAK
jgi:hypothetical protein